MTEKYSRAELHEMAKTVQAAKDNGDQRYLQFVMAMAVRCNLDPKKVMNMIEVMAKGK